MNDMKQEFANLTPEQRQLVELMLRQREDPTPTSPNTITRQRAVDAAPLSFAQQRLWFLEQLEPGSAAYNLALAMRVDGKLDVNALTQSLNEVVARHEVLRKTFAADDEGHPTQIVAPILTIALPMIELPVMSQAEQAARVQQLVLDEAGQPFHLAHGPLLQTVYFDLGAKRPGRLLLMMHHLIGDAYSLQVLAADFQTIYRQLAQGESVKLEAKTTSYKEWSENYQLMLNHLICALNWTIGLVCPGNRLSTCHTTLQVNTKTPLIQSIHRRFH